MAELAMDYADHIDLVAATTDPTIADSAFGLVALVYVTRCSRSLRAVSVLASHGHTPEASPIVRSMMEDSVNLAYISDRPVERAEAYIEFEDRRSYYYMRMLTRQGLKPGLTRERMNDLLSRYRRTEWRDLQWWAGIGPIDMAKELGDRFADLKREFLNYYAVYSDDVHGSAPSARNYVARLKDGASALVSGPSAFRMAETLYVSLYWAHHLTGIAGGLGVSVDTEGLSSVFDEAADIHGSISPEA